MGNANAGEWRYTARYGWNWRSARAISSALVSLALPMPSWFRAVVARCLLARTALQADAGHLGKRRVAVGKGGWPVPMAGSHGHRRMAVRPPEDHRARPRGDAVGGGPAARALASRTPQQSRPTRRRAFRRHPSFRRSSHPTDRLVKPGMWWRRRLVRRHCPVQATARLVAPHARFVDLSGVSVAPESGGPFGFAFEVLAGVFEVIGWRRLGWLLGVAASTTLAAAAANLGTLSHAPIGWPSARCSSPCSWDARRPSVVGGAAPGARRGGLIRVAKMRNARR